MQFDSLTFVVFFAVVLLAYNVNLAWGAKKTLLLLASYAFYSAWNPLFLPLLLISTTLDWWMALQMAKHSGRARKIWLAGIVMINIGVLGYFKYALFIAQSGASLLAWFGIDQAAPEFSIVLPLGISFYTFHSLSYCIDVYRKRFPATTNWRDYALYVSFFPQLVAGPIVRWTQMKEQIEEPRKSTSQGVAMGACLMVFGLFEKIVLADTVFAPVANAVFAEGAPGSVQVWVGVIAFSGQIFCDFAGYSTCAIGAALALGFRLPLNFHNPYAAVGFSDFWQRWHISLSTWLRDYLYVPLGGNRHGVLLTYRNLMLTMLIGGLWHGAAWTFVVWGAFHGGLLVLERLARRYLAFLAYLPSMLLSLLGGAITLVAVLLGWVWFRAVDLAQGWRFTKSMLHPIGVFDGLKVVTSAQWLALTAFLLLLLTQMIFRNGPLERVIDKTPGVVLGLVGGLCVALIILSPGLGNTFIYFQF